MYIAFFLEVGLLLVVMPWWPALWDHNYFVHNWPAIGPILTNNFFRGAVTGLGLVNLGAGFADLSAIFAARPTPGGRDPFDGPETQEWSGRS